MTRQTPKAVVEEIVQRKPFTPSYSKLIPPTVMHCSVVAPVTWRRNEIESAFEVTLPQDIVELWDAASEVRLHEDLTYGQWGCILWSPAEVVTRHKEALRWREPDDFRPGDLIIGEFRGDTDLIVLRCDLSQRDYGSIVIDSPMDSRDAWPCVASTITEFMQKFLAYPERKYWEATG